MTRIHQDTLAIHLEVALSCAPVDTLAALQDADGQLRRRATYTLAQHLADRLGCFDITGDGIGEDMEKQASLFRCPWLDSWIPKKQLLVRIRHVTDN